MVTKPNSHENREVIWYAWMMHAFLQTSKKQCHYDLKCENVWHAKYHVNKTKFTKVHTKKFGFGLHTWSYLEPKLTP